MKRLNIICISLAATLFMPVGSIAESVTHDKATAIKTEPKAALTILGLRLGQAGKEARAILKASDYSAINEKPVKAAAEKRARNMAKSQHLKFAHPSGKTVHVETAGEAELIIGLTYDFSDDLDVGAGLESGLRTRYGSPLARYKLGEQSHMLIWERVSPEQSRDFGPMTTLALTTGPQGKLVMSQFSKPATLSSSAAPRAANRAVLSRNPSPLGSVLASPTD